MQPSRPTYEQDASKVISKRNCYVSALQANTDGTNDATVIMYDSATPTTDETLIVCRFKVLGVDNQQVRYFLSTLSLSQGCYVSISGTGASYFVDYIDGGTM